MRRTWLDEAVFTLEVRRARRWLRDGLRPLAFVLSVIALPWVAAPALSLLLGLGGPGAVPDRHWMFGLLAASSALAAAGAAAMRATHFWHAEWRMGTLEALCAARPLAWPVVSAVGGAAAGFALLLAGVPTLAAAALGLLNLAPPGQVLASLAVVVMAAALGAALGTAGFFVEAQAANRWAVRIAALLGSALVCALWLRLEAVAGGWQRPWLEHPARVARALFLVTPVPPLLGIAVPGWWQRAVAAPLGLTLAAWQGALLWMAAALGVVAAASAVAARAYERLSAAPELLARRHAARRLDDGGLDHWRGFRNPVWTRDLRTRLRGREVGDLVMVATLVIAAAAFVPLLLLARDLGDPLDTARVARQVFYWLALTLTGFVGLVTPAMGAQAFVQERRCRSIEFLIATPLQAREIVWGKVLGAASVTALLLSPALPLLGLCALFRGASGGQVLELCGLLVLATLVSAFLGVTASAMHASAAWARWQGQLLALCFLALPGGALSMAGGTAAPERANGHLLHSDPGVSLLVIITAGIVVGLLGMNASERLLHSEE